MKKFAAVIVGFGLALTAQAELILEQSTATQAVLIGPFVDATDGVTPETGLTIDAADVRVSKNGANIVAKNSGGCTHDELGYYACTFDATDTNTVGRLQVMVAEAGALPVYHEFQVVEEAIHAQIWDASATGAHAVSSGGIASTAFAASAITATAIATDAITAAKIAADAIGASELAADSITSSELAATAAAEIIDNFETQSQADPTGFHVNVLEVGGTAQTANDNGADINAILADTNELQTDDYPARFTGIEGATFTTGTDSLEAIRDRGDAAWITGGGGTSVEEFTAVATAPTTTTITVDDPPDADDQINGWAIKITDNGDSGSYHLAKITDYVQSTGVITYDVAADFTVGADDIVAFLPAFLDEGVDVTTIEGTDATDQLDAHAAAGLDAAGVRTAIGLASANLDTQLSTIDTNVDDIETDTGTTLPATLATIDGNVDSILVDTGTTLQAEVDGIQADTENLQSRIPTALVGGRIDATVDGTGMEAGAVTAIQSGLATSSALATVDGNVDDIEAALGAVPTEPSAVPAWGSATVAEWIGYIGAWFRNEVQQTADTKTLRNDADDANLIQCAVSDNGTTAQVSECAAP